MSIRRGGLEQRAGSKLDMARRILGRMSLAERLLLAVSRHPREVGRSESHEAPTGEWTVDTALETLRRSFSGLDDLILGKRVLDYGSGDGFQSIALARAGAQSVVGVEIQPRRVEHARKLAAAMGQENVSFQPRIQGKFDVAISLNAMEHFVEPERNLQEMREALTEGGELLVSFGPPWFAPYGSHMYFFCAVPWINLVFSEKTVMRVRSLYRVDGLRTYAPELNRMTIRKFERLICHSGFRVASRKDHCSKNMNFFAAIPILRELFINQVDAVLTK